MSSLDYIDTGFPYCQIPYNGVDTNIKKQLYDIYRFDIPLLGQASGVYSVRKIVPAYSGPMFSISRISDNATAQLFTNEKGQITQLIVTSSGQ